MVAVPHVEIPPPSWVMNLDVLPDTVQFSIVRVWLLPTPPPAYMQSLFSIVQSFIVSVPSFQTPPPDPDDELVLTVHPFIVSVPAFVTPPP